MENNIEILNKWNKKLSKYKALKLEEAKELYQKLISTTDDDLRKQYKQELIIGTLHSVPRFIENNGLIYLNSSLYDMNDIIAVCNEIWIDKVNSGKLLEVDYYKEMFDSSYFSRLSADLGITRFSIANNTILDGDTFAGLFDVYIKLKANNINVDFIEVLECVKDNPKYEKVFQRMHFYDCTVDFCELFDAIIESFNLGDNDLKLSKTNFDKLKYIFISNGLERLRGNMTNLATKDPTVAYVDNACRKQVIDKVLDEELDEKHRDVLVKLYGILDGECHTLKEVADDYGVTPEAIRMRQAKALRLLRRHDSKTKLDGLK